MKKPAGRTILAPSLVPARLVGVKGILGRHWMRACKCLVLSLLACLAVASGSACWGGQPVSDAEPAAPWPTEGWATATPEEQGMDADLLADMLAEIGEQDHAIDSVSVVRHGYMVLDATIHPFQPDWKHPIHSCTKSIVSALIGIAIEQGHLEGVDVPVLQLFPDRTAANLDANKEAMTLEHLLTMTSGWECRDSYLYRWRGLEEMAQTDDWVQFMLDLPMADKPGTHFEYCNGVSFLLSAIVQETTGQTALEFAQERLFGPLGITEVDWPSNPQGISVGWGQIRMKPHDMAKIGYLYLHGGLWDGEQIVPAEWVQVSTREHTPATLQDGYGYQWWVDDSGYYMALGYAGQLIFVIPDRDMVVVFTSDLAERDFYTPQELLVNFVLPSAKSAATLPENPDGLDRLRDQIETLGNAGTTGNLRTPLMKANIARGL
jgi:CubicO group peptidase (beta-lactamase class C family)